jgi:thiamine-phosphate diphosphorylase
MSAYDLCVITARSDRLGRSHLDVAKAALEGGCRLLQFRDKSLSSRDLWAIGVQMRRLTRDYQARLIINDRVDIALAVEADGVHLGGEDLPIAAARRLFGERAIIGASVADPERAALARSEGATYLGVGPVYATSSKADADDAIGLSRIREIRDAAALPVLAIGGINRSSVEAVIRADADGIAVISAVSEANDMVAATAELLDAIRVARRSVGRAFPRPPLVDG